MPSESYWLQAEADARAVALRTSSDAWTKLADLYRENAEKERKPMSDIERKLTKRLEDMFMEAAMGGPPKKLRQTAMRVRGRSFETVELDDAGKVIEPLRCICGGMIVIHRPQCPFYCLAT